MFHYSTEYFGVSHFVIAVNPKWWDFYQSVLLFTPLEKNLFHFFTDTKPNNMEFPMRKRGVIWDPVLTPKLMRYFFIEMTKTFESLSEFEVSILRELYDTDEYRNLIRTPKVVRIKMRKEKRFECRLFGRIVGTDETSVVIETQNVGLHSMDGIVRGTLPVGVLRICVDIEDYKGCQLDGTILRLNAQGFFVAQLPNPPDLWQNFITNLNRRLLQENEQVKIKSASTKSV